MIGTGFRLDFDWTGFDRIGIRLELTIDWILIGFGWDLDSKWIELEMDRHCITLILN